MCLTGHGWRCGLHEGLNNALRTRQFNHEGHDEHADSKMEAALSHFACFFLCALRVLVVKSLSHALAVGVFV